MVLTNNVKQSGTYSAREFPSQCEKLDHDIACQLELDRKKNPLTIVSYLMISGSIKYSSSTSSIRSYNNDHNSRVIGNNAVIVRGNVGAAPYRTLDDVRQQVAQEVAVRVITNAEILDGETPPRCPFLEIKCAS